MAKANDGDGAIYPRTTKKGTVYDVRMSVPGATGRYYKGGFTTKKAAIAHRDQIKRRNNLAGHMREKTLTLPQVIDKWLDATPGRAATTMILYRGVLDRHIATRLNVPVAQVSERLLSEYFTDLPNHISKHGTTGRGIAKATLDMVRAALTWAQRPSVGLIDSNPIRDTPISIPAMQKRRLAMSPDEVQALLSASKGQQSQLLWRTLLATGARKGEMTPLTHGDVDYARRGVSISKISAPETKGATVALRTKGKKARFVPLTDDLLKSFAEMKLATGSGPNDPVFVAPRKGGSIGFGTIDKWFLRDLKAAGLTGYSMHSLRHTWATEALAAGIPINVVSAILGHASPIVTMTVYSHVTSDQQRAAVNSVAENLARRRDGQAS